METTRGVASIAYMHYVCRLFAHDDLAHLCVAVFVDGLLDVDAGGGGADTHATEGVVGGGDDARWGEGGRLQVCGLEHE